MFGMSLILSATTAVLLLLSAERAKCQRLITVPEAKLEFLSPRGLKISIPDVDDGITLVAFHVNINEEFFALEHGQWAQDIIKKKDGRWTYTIPDFKVKQGDTIYYWIYVIVEGIGSQGLDRVYKVTQANPHGDSSSPPPRPLIPEEPNRYPEEPTKCEVSATRRDGGVSSCKGQVILDKHFNNLDGWNHRVHIGGSQSDDEFMVFTDDPATSFIQDNNLVIKPILLEEKYNDTFVRTGKLTLQGCTSSSSDQCCRQGVSFLILPPIMSARLTSRNSFTFRYGIVEVRAKLPSGDWIVPELWLEPKVSASDDQPPRVVLAMARGNTDSDMADNNRHLEAGLVTDRRTQMVKKTSNKKWSRDYHTFKLQWTQDQIVFYVDNDEISRLPTSNQPWLQQEMFITLGVHVAGSRDFPDNLHNKPWKNTNPKRFVQFWESKNVWHYSWNDKSALRVDHIKVTAI